LISDIDLKVEDKIYWGRAFGGCVLGILTTILGIDRFGSIIPIIIAILVYLVSAICLRIFISAESRSMLGRKIYLTGSGTYSALWLLAWILSHNLL